MAGNKLIARQVKASSILEVLIAMIVILVVFGIAMTIFSNVMQLSLSGKKIRAQALLVHTLISAEQAKDPVNQSFVVDQFKIEQEIKPYENNMALIEIDLTAYDENQQKIAELQKVILNKND